MQPVNPQRRDPAPSRAAYRLHRLWLTPVFRTAMRVGLPLALSFGLAIGYLSDEARRDELALKLSELRRSIEERPEFMVKLMAIDGASGELGEDIREVLPVDFPISSFDLDLEEMRAIVADLDAVADVSVRVRTGGILQIDVTERLPAVVWRGREAVELLDAQGHRVSALPARAIRPDLPLIAGDGADAAVPEALALMAASGPIADRLRGLVRMGERRWDLVLDRGQRILLPETGAVAALERVIALDTAQDLLARDLTIVDMRNTTRPTIRLADTAVEELRRIKGLEIGE